MYQKGPLNGAGIDGLSGNRIEAGNLSPDVPNSGASYAPESNPRLDFQDIPDSNASLLAALGTIKAQAELAAQRAIYPETATTRIDAGAIPLGNVRERTLQEILDDPRSRAIVKGFREGKLVEELCKRCQYIERFQHAGATHA